MPKVGKKKFPYTKEGIKAAKKYSKKIGEPVYFENKYEKGGVPEYAEGGGVKYYQMQRKSAAPSLHEAKPMAGLGGGLGAGAGGAAGAPEEGEPMEDPTTTEEGTPGSTIGCPCEDGSYSEDCCDQEEKKEEPVDDKKCPEGLFPDESGNCVEPMSKKEERFENQEQEDEFYKDTPQGESNINAKIIGPEEDNKTLMQKGSSSFPQEEAISLKPEKITKIGGDKKIELPKRSGGGESLADKIKDKTSGDGESLADKIKDKTSGSGGGGNPLEAIKEKTEEITAKKGAMVKKQDKPKVKKKNGEEENKGYRPGSLYNEKGQRINVPPRPPADIDDVPFSRKYKEMYGPAGDADPDQLTFGEAFRGARHAGVSRFKWRGKYYTTELKKGEKKYHKGGKVKANKKGMAIIIAIGKPKINKKSKKR
tara:strand:- start:2441 stop:3706 length:1266 start_codon:yes stop_codon:yes gene_type:complete